MPGLIPAAGTQCTGWMRQHFPALIVCVSFNADPTQTIRTAAIGVLVVAATCLCG